MAYVETKLNREIVIDSIITIHYFEYMKDFVFHGESHNFWEFLYVDKGSVLVQAGKEHIQLEVGDIIFHEPNEFHAIRSIGSSSPNLIAISFKVQEPELDFFRKLKCTLTKQERTLISCIINTAKECFSTPMNQPSVEQIQLVPDAPFGAEQLVLLYLELFLITVRRNHCVNLPASSPSAPPVSGTRTLKASRVEEAIEYMQLHLCESLSLSSICNALSVSRSTLQSIFHEEKNCGVMEYFNNLKIQKAKEIIRDGTMNFTEISYFLSYSSLQYFSKQFKKSTGMSPMEYASSIKGMTQALQKAPSPLEEF